MIDGEFVGIYNGSNDGAIGFIVGAAIGTKVGVLIGMLVEVAVGSLSGVFVGNRGALVGCTAGDRVSSKYIFFDL